MNSITPSPIPSRATAEPPSGTAVARIRGKTEKVMVTASVLDGKRPRSNGVIKPVQPLMMPVPVMFRNVAVWSTTVALMRLNANPC